MMYPFAKGISRKTEPASEARERQGRILSEPSKESLALPSLDLRIKAMRVLSFAVLSYQFTVLLKAAIGN